MSPKSKPYTPSWTNLFVNWIDRIPGPAWSNYIELGLTLFLLQLVVLWAEGALQSGYRPLIQGYLTGAVVIFLALFNYLDELASVALTTLRPAMKSSEDEFKLLHFQLTTLPAFPTILASLTTLAFVFLSESLLGTYHPEALDPFPISAGILRFGYLAAWWVFGAFIYHTIHQLRLVNNIYSKDTRVDLFQMKPLYAFSSHSAFTALSMAAIPYGWIAINPVDWQTEPIVVIVMLGITVLAVATFVWPHLGIHRLQIAEKDRLLDEASKRLEDTITELHKLIDAGKMEGMFEMSSAMSSLKTELSLIEETPTWPWRAETLRWLASALLLPLGLWLVQLFLQRVLSP